MIYEHGSWIRKMNVSSRSLRCSSGSFEEADLVCLPHWANPPGWGRACSGIERVLALYVPDFTCGTHCGNACRRLGRDWNPIWSNLMMSTRTVLSKVFAANHLKCTSTLNQLFFTVIFYWTLKPYLINSTYDIFNQGGNPPHFTL